MWEDYSDFISNFRDDLVEPYILPDSTRFARMCKTGSLGDYLGLPTFGTRIHSTNTLTDCPCAAKSRSFTDSPLETVMNKFRAGESIPGTVCADSLNTNGAQTILFCSLSSW